MNLQLWFCAWSLAQITVLGCDRLFQECKIFQTVYFLELSLAWALSPPSVLFCLILATSLVSTLSEDTGRYWMAPMIKDLKNVQGEERSRVRLMFPNRFVKSVRILSYSCPCFPDWIRSRKTPNADTFYAVFSPFTTFFNI